MSTLDPTLRSKLDELFRLVTVIIKLMKDQPKDTKEYHVMVAIANQLLYMEHVDEGDVQGALGNVKMALNSFQESFAVAFEDNVEEARAAVAATTKKAFMN
jgi:hypothetical protein